MWLCKNIVCFGKWTRRAITCGVIISSRSLIRFFYNENIGNYPRLWKGILCFNTEIGKNQTKTKIIDLSFITIRLFYCYTFSLMTTDIDIKLHLYRHISPSFYDFVFREIIISWGLVEWITFCLFRRQVFWCIHGTSQNSTASPRRSCFPACSTGWLVDIFSLVGQNTNG